MKIPAPGKILSKGAALIGKRAVGTTAAVALVSSLLVVAAVRADGVKATNVRLDDGAVWVSNQRAQRVGRLNIRVNELDLAVQSNSTPDVLQDGRTVLFPSSDGGVKRMDVVGGTPAGGKNTIDLATYRIAGGVGVVTDPVTGKLWVGRADSIVAPEYPKKAMAKIEPGSKIVVTDAASGRLTKNGESVGRVLVVQKDAWYDQPRLRRASRQSPRRPPRLWPATSWPKVIPSPSQRRSCTLWLHPSTTPHP